MLHKFRKLLCAEGDAVRLHILNVLQDHYVFRRRVEGCP